MATDHTAATGKLSSVDPAWAWAAFTPDERQPWDLGRAAHLYRRAAFGADWQMLQEAVAAGCSATVDRLLAGGDDAAEFYQQSRALIGALAGSGDRKELPAWWLRTMHYTPHPLLEKMTLFWHGHFATSAAKVDQRSLMYRQNETLRKHALGKFGPLLNEMARDPAMLIWLDSATNRKGHPNENFAREVMELFALGLGHYTEEDIQEAARAFTGWEVRHGKFYFNRTQHDSGEKTVLGRTGRFNGEEVVGILLRQPAAAEFIATKMFLYLVSDELPPEPLIAPLAAGYRDRDDDMAWLAGTILRSNLFYSPLAMRQKIKSPVEFALGLIRALEGTANFYALADDLEALGQGVFFPPNVKGWDGGGAWINSATLLGRANLVWALVGSADARYAGRCSLERLACLDETSSPADEARRLVELLIAGPVPDAVLVQLTALAADRSSDVGPRRARLAQAVATLPEFQIA